MLTFIFLLFLQDISSTTNKNNLGLEILRRFALNQGCHFSNHQPQAVREVQTDTGVGRKEINRFPIAVTNLLHCSAENNRGFFSFFKASIINVSFLVVSWCFFLFFLSLFVSLLPKSTSSSAFLGYTVNNTGGKKPTMKSKEIKADLFVVCSVGFFISPSMTATIHGVLTESPEGEMAL